MYTHVGEDDEYNVFCTVVGANIKVNNLEVNTCENNIEWLLDNGFTDHIINNDSYYSKSKKLSFPVDVKIGDGKILKATKVGNVTINSIVNGNKVKIGLENVFFVKEMDRNLISYGKITNNNKIVSVGNTAKIFNRNRELIAIAYKVNDLYKLNSTLGKTEAYVTMNENENMTLKEKYHRMLGHVNFNYLETLCKERLVEGMPNTFENEYLKCGTCV